MADSFLVRKARRFAIRAHGLVVAQDGSLGQRRKYTGEPYINHLREVALLVREHDGDEAQIAAAWLHDTVEDTPVTLEYLEQVFGREIAELVHELTHVFTAAEYPGLSRAERKNLEAERLAQISARGQTIKYADFVSNTRNVLVENPAFGAKILPEIALTLSRMTRGDQRLRARVGEILARSSISPATSLREQAQ